MEAVRWGILSVSGHYALRVHSPLSQLAEARIVAIASRDKAKASAAAARFGISKSHPSYEALLSDPEVEAVYIPLPNDLHEEWTEKALRAGKHVLCEKPLAMNVAEAKKMAALAREKGLLLMEAFMYRFHPQWLRAKEIVLSGEIGTVRAVTVNFSYNNADPANIRNRMENGGGALYDIGCYAISASRWMAGAEPSRCLALVERDRDFGTDRLSSAILDFGASRATFNVGTRLFPVQRVDVVGDKGALAIILPFNAYPDVPLSLEVSTSLGTRTVVAGPTDQYAAMFSAFGRALRSGAPAPTPIEDGIANMAVIDSLFRSEKSGTWASVEN